MSSVGHDSGGSPGVGALPAPGALKRAASTADRHAAVTDLPRSGAWARLGRVLLLVGADLTSVAVTMAVAYLVWAGGRLEQPPSIYAGLLPAALLLFAASYAVAGLYPGFGLGPVEILRRLSIATTAAFTVLAAAVFVLKLPHVYSRLTIGLAYLGTLTLLPLVRWGIGSLAGRLSWWGEPVVVVGDGDRHEDVIRELRRRPERGFRPVVALSSAAGQQPVAAAVAGVPLLGGVELGPELARRGLHVAVVVQGDLSLGELGALLRASFPRVIVIGDDRDLPVEQVEVRNLGNLLGIEYCNRLLYARNRFIKRGMDLVLGSVAMLIAGPVVALAAVLIKLCDRGPAFFFQEREGLDGRSIRICKLRTMRTDAEERLEEHLGNNEEARRQWERSFKLVHDPRVIPCVGRVLRLLSIDELPQLASVVRGDMSLVGPRPLPDYHLRNLPEGAREIRRHVRPGLTGLWQVSARGRAAPAVLHAHDTYYIRNWSIWLDLYLVARTVAAVLTGRGAS